MIASTWRFLSAALPHDLTPTISALRSEIDNPIHILDHVEVMFDDHYGVAGFDEPIEHVVRHSPVVVPGPRSRVQCPDAVVAPMPVSERTCWARKPPRSFAAWLLRSRIENNQMPTKPIVIENSAGEVYGNSALPFG